MQDRFDSFPKGESLLVIVPHCILELFHCVERKRDADGFGFCKRVEKGGDRSTSAIESILQVLVTVEWFPSGIRDLDFIKRGTKKRVGAGDRFEGIILVERYVASKDVDEGIHRFRSRENLERRLLYVGESQESSLERASYVGCGHVCCHTGVRVITSSKSFGHSKEDMPVFHGDVAIEDRGDYIPAVLRRSLNGEENAEVVLNVEVKLRNDQWEDLR